MTFSAQVVGTVYALFDTFGVIHAVTVGGPTRTTEILVYKVHNDGFVRLTPDPSAMKALILIVIVIGLTVF